MYIEGKSKRKEKEMTKIYIPEKVDVVLHPALFALNDTIKQAILGEASNQLNRPVIWDDIEDYNINLEVELSLFAQEAETGS